MVFLSLVCFISLNWLTLTFNYIGHCSYQPLFEEIAPPFLQQLLRLLNILGYNAVQLLNIVYEVIFMLRLPFLLGMSSMPCYHAQWRSYA